MKNFREKLLYSSIQHFFQQKQNLNIVIPIISGKDSISLRILDWFITNYARENMTQYMQGNKQFIVYLDTTKIIPKENF